MNDNNDWESKLDAWEEKYKPIDLDGDSGEGFHVDYEVAIKKAKELNPKNPNFHIWTLMDSDDGELQIYTTGVRLVNRIDYLVTERSWENDVREGELLEVIYFDFNDIDRDDDIVSNMEEEPEISTSIKP